ncbi:hypothetical protein [Natronomonas sp. EA1]|uniref:hypothetical protein n=1 Tax=Natronomonas sp. EA1 TaxID=3421655 RepID=UPI003EBB58A3
MNLSRFSKALAAVLVLSLIATPVAAVAVTSENLPAETQAQSEASATFTFSELYADGSQEWTLEAKTNLTGAQWTVKKQKLGGDVVSESYQGRTFETTVSSNENVETVTVTVTGDVPKVKNFTYDPVETYLFAGFNKTVGSASNVIATERVHHFTEKSKEARNAIESAQAAIDAAGGDQQAQQTLNNAISSYNNGNFANAIDLANQAEQRATQKQEVSSRNQLLLYAGIGVVALLAVVGGVLYWRSQQDSYDKLR